MTDDWLFLDPSHRPEDVEILDALGPASGVFARIVDLTVNFDHEWKYARGSGWSLKIADRRKALLYAIPLRGTIRIGLTVREHEREVLLGEPDLAGVRDELLESRKYVEGFGLSFDISDEEESLRVEALLSRIMALRE